MRRAILLSVCLFITIAVGQPLPVEWTLLAEIPEMPSGKRMKNGSWIVEVNVQGEDVIYAAKGSTIDFYRYHPLGDSWVELERILIPDTASGPLGAGSRGVTDGVRYVYLVKGRLSNYFGRYDTQEDTWVLLPEIPPGSDSSSIGAGSDACMVDRGGEKHVYVLRGGERPALFRYGVTSAQWSVLDPPPQARDSTWHDGSFVVYDGGDYIYAHQGRSHSFWVYDIAVDQWQVDSLTSMPEVSSTGDTCYLQEGGCGAWNGDGLYALKAGGFEFWHYAPVADTWMELLQVPPGIRRRKVTGGADIISTGPSELHILKGSNTSDLYRCGLAGGVEGAPAAVLPRAVGPSIIRAPELARMDCRVLDIMGRDVTERKAVLAPGVYFALRASSAEREASSIRKVVIQR